MVESECMTPEKDMDLYLQKMVKIFLSLPILYKIQMNALPSSYDVKIINPTPENQSILLPIGEKLLIRKISNYGIIDGIRSCKKIGVSAEDVLAHDIAIWELEYVYISLIRNHGEYRFFKKF